MSQNSKKSTYDYQIFQILSTIISKPKSAKEISKECDIPINTVYRKLRYLESEKFLKTSGFLSNGVRTRTFQTYDWFKQYMNN